MSLVHSTTLSVAQRRRGLRVAILSSVLASAGSVLTIGTLFLGFALATNNLSSRSAMHWVLALAAIVGLSRLLAPLLIPKFRGLRLASISCLALSSLFSIGLPLVMLARGIAGEATDAFATMVVIQQGLEVVGMVAVWAWIGELAPSQIRGRYLGQREGWRLLTAAPLVVIVGWGANYLAQDKTLGPQMLLWAFAIPIAIGGVLQLASALVLLWTPDVKTHTSQANGLKWITIILPWIDQRYFRLLLFACWSSFFLGITLRAQESFPRHTLELGLLPVLGMVAGMTIGQAAGSPWFGRLCDRYGNRPVIAVSQLIAASGMLFYLFASPEQPWWIVGAWVMFIANAGVTIGLNTLMLKLAPQDRRSIYVANFLAFTALAYALGVVIGSIMFEEFWYDKFPIANRQFDNFDYLFYIGWVTRTMGVILLFGLTEPGAISWAEILRRRSGGMVFEAVPEASRHPLD